jgi:hypothetical protein
VPTTFVLLAGIDGWRSIHLLHFLPRMCSTQSGRQYPHAPAASLWRCDCAKLTDPAVS